MMVCLRYLTYILLHILQVFNAVKFIVVANLDHHDVDHNKLDFIEPIILDAIVLPWHFSYPIVRKYL